MIPYSFEYKRATSIEEALQMIDDDNRPLAGGHSLIPALKLRLSQTGKLIDISRIERLRDIKLDGNVLHIGATSTHTSISEHADIKAHLPLYSVLAGKIGDVQVRNAGTIGGSLAHADPAADWPAALLASDAVIHAQSKTGKREIPSNQFFTGIYSTDLAAGELITSIRVPSMSGKKAHYEKFAQPASRFALVGCAIAANVGDGHFRDVRVAFTGLSDVPFRDNQAEAFLEGKLLHSSTVEEAAGHRNKDIFIMSDHFADETYRFHLAGVMLTRSLNAIL